MRRIIFQILPLAVALILLFLLLAEPRPIFSLLGIQNVLDDPDLLATVQKCCWLLIAVTGAFLFNAVIDMVVWEGLVRKSLGHPVPSVLKQVVSALIFLLIAILVVRFVFDQNVLAFITAVGAFGVVLGFGVRGLFADIMTSMAISLDRPFVIGDWIRVEGNNGAEPIVGAVMEISLRTTQVQTERNGRYSIPNRLLGDKPILNYWNDRKEYRMELELEFDFSIQHDRVKRVLLAATKAVLHEPGFLEHPEPQVLLIGFDGNGAKFRIRYWITPWQGTSPSKSEDVVFSSVLVHARQAGLTPTLNKIGIFRTRQPETVSKRDLGEELVRILGIVELFQPLRKEELKTLIEQSQECMVPAGRNLIVQGDEGDSMFVMVEGLVDVYVRQDGGRPIRVGQIGPGQFFGEMSLLTGAPRSATVTAATAIFALEVTKEAMTELIHSRPELGETIAHIVAKRDAETTRARMDRQDGQTDAEVQSLASQLYARMRAFFGKA
jgi:small-conductance mechanosensitive channel/CRP-like cAMP-binding protein